MFDSIDDRACAATRHLSVRSQFLMASLATVLLIAACNKRAEPAKASYQPFTSPEDAGFTQLHIQQFALGASCK